MAFKMARNLQDLQGNKILDNTKTQVFSIFLMSVIFFCCFWPVCSSLMVVNKVFLTHVGIRQMPTWLPTWKAKSLYHVGNFLPTWVFVPLQKSKTIKIPIPEQIRAHYIFQGILKTFLKIYALLFIFRKL